jgi:hypothetical protein
MEIACFILENPMAGPMPCHHARNECGGLMGWKFVEAARLPIMEVEVDKTALSVE